MPGFTRAGAAWIGEIARRKARDRYVIPVTLGIAVVSVVIATIALPYHDLSDPVPVTDPAVVVPAVPVVDGDGAVPTPGPVLGRAVAVGPLDDHDPRALHHVNPTGVRALIGRVSIPNDDVSRDRYNVNRDNGLHSLRVKRVDG